MQCYSDDRAFQHLLLDPMHLSSAEQRLLDDKLLVSFNGVDSISEFVKKIVIDELLQSEKIASSIFLSQIQSYCKL